jgi:class 3 adenylate cyclase
MPASRDDLPRAPRSLPRWLVNGVAVAAAGLFWAAVLAGGLLVFQEPPAGETSVSFTWDARHIAAVACFPAVLGLWWRRQRPLAVLGLAFVVTIAAFDYSALMGAIALYTASTVLPLRRAVLVGLIAVALEVAGYSLWLGTPGWDDLLLMVVATAVATALGLYVGARRAYFDRLKERALFARALASFLPAGVAELIEDSPSALSLEQEIEATVLFSDIRGFSTVAEELSPREVAEVVGRHASAMAEVVLAHGGMLDKFAGDGVMAVFGAPKPMPGDPDRAIACAVAMQRRQRELNAESPHADALPMEIGIGINTGLVIAGTLGGAGRLDYTVIGDAVNVAQRLQSEAGPGEILVSAQTAACCSWPSAEAAGARQLKGRREPVEVFRIAWEAASSDVRRR